MADDKPSLRARPWKRPPDSGRASAPRKSYRFVFRLLGIPVLAVAGVLVYNGIRERLYLPECDSERAKKSIADVLRQLKLEPTSYAPIKTVSATKNDVVCSALLPLPDGANVAVDFTFYWQADTASMKYSVARRPANEPPPTPPLR
jgi:hypothetical protein